MKKKSKQTHAKRRGLSLFDVRHIVVSNIAEDSVVRLLEGVPARIICDPWARIGSLAGKVNEAMKPGQLLLCTQEDRYAAIGKERIHAAQWHVGDPLKWLNSLHAGFDAVISALPWTWLETQSITLRTMDGTSVRLHDSFENLLMAKSAVRLNKEGIGIFIIPPSFFSSPRSVLRAFGALGLGIEAALELPSGTYITGALEFRPYLIVVRRRPYPRMFVGKLSNDMRTNSQIISNFKKGKEGGTLELGRYVESHSFRGLDHIRLSEWYVKAKKEFGAPAVPLGRLSTSITLGRSSDNFVFPSHENSIYIPLVGLNDVVDSVDDISLKRQSYAQAVIDPNQSMARFVKQFLNSEFGKNSRELIKSGALISDLKKECLKDMESFCKIRPTIRRLNLQNIKDIDIFIPALQFQKEMLRIDSRIADEENTIRSLHNELTELRRDLWSNPKSSANVVKKLGVFAGQLSGGLRQHALGSLDRWIETLPFPLASILRSWQATPSQDFKTRYEHLLHFFEATAEFVSIILLSVFKANAGLYEPYREKLKEILTKQHLSLSRPTFGTWKIIVEYFGKQTRDLISDEEKQSLCAEMFNDPSFLLPRTVSSKELAGILVITNKMRNDWPAHGGVVGDEEAKRRNQMLLTELQKLREVFSEAWTDSQLIYGLNNRPLRGMFENEIALLMGSNNEFLKESRLLNTWLDVEQLYLSNKNSNAVVKVIPLIWIGHSPKSAKNACYFFNRLESDSARFVSFHFADRPELEGQIEEVSEVLKALVG